MGATNTTANYSLSQFIGTDKPAWLQDYNGDMLKIDTGINAAKVAADGAQNSASAAQNDANTANSAITNTINPAISSLNTTVGNQGGAINTINSLIGNGTPTTTDQTIIGAINEINANVTSMFYQSVAKIYGGAGKTYSSILDEIYTAFNNSTIVNKEITAVLVMSVSGALRKFSIQLTDSTQIAFTMILTQPYTATAKSSSSIYKIGDTDYSSSAFITASDYMELLIKAN